MTGPQDLPMPGVADHTARFRGKVAAVSSARADSWDALADVLAGPDETVVEGLRSGRWATVWRDGSQWLGEHSGMFTTVLVSLEAYARGARRRDPGRDAAALRADRGSLVDPYGAVVPHIRQVARMCRQESAAWSAGEIEAGREWRARQKEYLDVHVCDVLPELGGRLVRDAEAAVWRSLGRLMFVLLTTETGRDYLRSVLGERRPRHPRPDGPAEAT